MAPSAAEAGDAESPRVRPHTSSFHDASFAGWPPAAAEMPSDRGYGEGWTHNDLGEALIGLGDLQRAMTELMTALRIRESVGDLYGKSWTLRNIGLVHLRNGISDSAREAFTEALDLWRRTR